VFTDVLTDDPDSRAHLDSVRALAQRRGSLFLTVLVTCDTDVQVSRIDNPDRIALRKGSDPEGYRRWRPRLLEPPADEVLRVDTTTFDPATNAATILSALVERGYEAAPPD
jgi:hypothetical protein